MTYPPQQSPWEPFNQGVPPQSGPFPQQGPQFSSYGPPPYGQPGGYPGGFQPPQPPRRNIGLIIAIVVAAVVLLGGGVTTIILLAQNHDNNSTVAASGSATASGQGSSGDPGVQAIAQAYATAMSKKDAQGIIKLVCPASQAEVQQNLQDPKSVLNPDVHETFTVKKTTVSGNIGTFVVHAVGTFGSNHIDEDTAPVPVSKTQGKWLICGA